jgi:hypothetical protein
LGICGSGLLLAGMPQQNHVTKLYEVQRIYVGEMGSSDETERFRLLLEDELRKKGFTIGASIENADAVLTGILSLRPEESRFLARATVRLKTATNTLWSGDFEPKLHLRGPRDSVKLRAQDIADKLRDDWKKSAKVAGVKPMLE